MISYITGELVEIIDDNTIVVDNNGIGLNIFTPATLIQELPSIGEMVRVYTYLYVREDAMNLFGFMTREELNIFKMLINVNGIGPKGALAILSTVTVSDLKFAILSEDVAVIKSAPGIGAKTAQRVIIDLKDKLSLTETFENALEKKKTKSKSDNTIIIRSETIEALEALGYNKKEAMEAVKSIDNIGQMDVEAALKEALKRLAIM